MDRKKDKVASQVFSSQILGTEKSFLDKKYVVAYTDGSCNWQSKKGGIGVYLKWKKDSGEIRTSMISKGFFTPSTIGQMELYGLLVCLRTVKPRFNLIVFSDSRYVVNSFNERWVYSWDLNLQRNGHLWKLILAEIKKREVFKSVFIIQWTPSHVGVIGNEVADRLATSGYHSEEQTNLEL